MYTRRFVKRVIDINRFQNGCGVNAAANDACGCRCFVNCGCGIGCGTVTYVGPTGPTPPWHYPHAIRRVIRRQL